MLRHNGLDHLPGDSGTQSLSSSLAKLSATKMSGIAPYGLGPVYGEGIFGFVKLSILTLLNKIYYTNKFFKD